MTKSDVLVLLGDCAFTGRDMHERIIPLLDKAQELGVWPQLAPILGAFVAASEAHLDSIQRLRAGLEALEGEGERPPDKITWN